MGGKDDSKAIVYIAVGALAAVGAGYLVWRYGMTEESRQRTVQALREASRKASQAARTLASSAKDTMKDTVAEMGNGATQVRTNAMRKAGEIGQRLRE